MLTDKQLRMLELYYYDDLSLGEIAQSEGISRQGVRDCIKRGEKTLLELEDKIRAAGTASSLYRLVEYVRASCDEIISACKRNTTSKSVIKMLEEIKAGADKFSPERME